MTYAFGEEVLTISTTSYHDGNLAVVAVDADGCPYATLSVNTDKSAALPEGAFYLKDWSENLPLATALLEDGVLVAVDAAPVILGHVWAEAYRLA